MAGFIFVGLWLYVSQWDWLQINKDNSHKTLPGHVGLTQALCNPIIYATETMTHCLPSNDH